MPQTPGLVRPHTPTFVIAIAAAALFLAGCGGGSDDGAAAAQTDTAEDAAATGMGIADAWSRQPAEGQTVTAVYGIVSNPTDADVTIVAASSPVTDQVELHETLVDDDGVMQMVERPEGFVVPAGGEFAFEPGGPHVMLTGIDPATYPKEVEITFEFDTADSVTFMAEVRAIDGASAGMEHGDDADMVDDHGGDSAMGDDHDHGDDADKGNDDGDDSAMGADHDDAGLDVSALHEVDEQLANGRLDAEAQRAVVADYIEVVEAMNGEAGSAEAELLVALQDLDAALAAGDTEAAATLAAAAHDIAHDLGHGHG